MTRINSLNCPDFAQQGHTNLHLYTVIFCKDFPLRLINEGTTVPVVKHRVLTALGREEFRPKHFYRWRWLRWVVSFKPRPFYVPGASPLYPFYTILGGPYSRHGHIWERIFSFLCQKVNSYSPVAKPPAYTLHWLSYPCSAFSKLHKSGSN
jgi:hypothetical protein